MGKTPWTIERLATYLQALADTGIGDLEIYVHNSDEEHEGGMLMDAKFIRNEGATGDEEPGLLWLGYSNHRD